MENLDNDLDLLERYQNGDLLPEERSRVEERLDTDPTFAQLYRTSLLAVEAIRAYGEDQTRELLQHIHREEQQQTSSGGRIRQLPLRSLLAAAATVAFILAAALWLLNRPPSPEDLFRQYYTAPALDQVRSGTETNPLLSQAEASYGNGDFANALAYLQQYRESRSLSGKALLLLGICQLETGEEEAAESTFQALSGEPGYNDQAAWYLALLYLRQENFAAASIELTRIISGEITATPARQAEAAGLLSALNRLSR